MTKSPSRAGFALPVAVFALVVVGVLVTGGFYLARQETRIGVASDRAAQAFYLAERGAAEVLSEWNAGLFGGLSNWQSATVRDTVAEGTWEVQVTRLASRLYFLLSTGTVFRGAGALGEASRRVGVIARMNTAEILPNAALTTVGSLRVGGSSYINGFDSIPAGWGSLCGSPGPAKPGILIDETTNITYSGNAYGISGNPPIAQDAGLSSQNLLEFGELRWNDLVAMADIRVAPGTTVTQLAPDSVQVGGTWLCRSGQVSPRNWGDPDSPGGVCGGYFPIIYAEGNLNVNSNKKGQGILLVEGDLSVQGGHTFYGPVIVRGSLKTAGTGGHFRGGVIAANVDLETNTVLGNALVQYSSCAISRALLGNSSLTRVRPLDRRSWVDLSSILGN